METFISRQAFLIILSFALGGLLGFLYDLIRPLRRRLPAFGRAAADFVYSFTAASVLFVFSMSAGNGRLGLWELGFALAGFLAYLYTLSDPVFAFFDRELTAILYGAEKISGFLEETEKSIKNIFKKIMKCYNIKDRS